MLKGASRYGIFIEKEKYQANKNIVMFDRNLYMGNPTV